MFGGARHSLDHVENLLVLVQPNVMVRDCHFLKDNLFGVLEVRVWSPHPIQPIQRQLPIVRIAEIGRFVGYVQPVILPALRHKDVGRVRLCAAGREGREEIKPI